MVDLAKGIKFDEGKLRWDLLPPYALRELVKLYNHGAQKYEARNWEKGLAWSRCFNALMRHSWAWMAGETHDPEFGLNHMVHAAFCCLSLVEFEKTHPEFDDRPIRHAKQSKPKSETPSV
jgi:Domain of unknown function (DUF5664)